MSATGGVKSVLPPSPNIGARFLVAGSSLEHLLPLTFGNDCEELG
jgi:hypothetical protein